MPIRISCPSCGKLYSLPDRLAGKTARCTACKAIIKIPATTDETTELAAFGEVERTVAPPAYAGPRRPAFASEPFLSDDAARMVSWFLVAGVVVVCIWLTYSVRERLTPPGLPSAIQFRMTVYCLLLFVWTMIIFYGIVAPLVLGLSALACHWTKTQLPGSSYLRAAGTAAVPFVFVFLTFMLAFSRDREGMAVLPYIACLVLLITLKELMGLRWIAMGIAGGLSIVLLWAIGYYAQPVNISVIAQIKTIVGLDRPTLEKWRRDHPEEIKAARTEQAQRAAAERPPDPYVGQIEPLLTELRDAVKKSSTQTQEQIRVAHKDLAEKLDAFAPTNDSLLLMQAKSQLTQLNKAANDAPSENPPDTIFTEIADTPLAVIKAADEDFADPVGFGALRIRPLKSSKLDLESFAQRATLQRWKLDNYATLEIALKPLADPKQQRPWIADREVISQLAAEKKLFAIIEIGEIESIDGRFNGIGWTRAIKRDAFKKASDPSYIARLADSWAVVTLKPSHASAESIALADKFVQGISLAKPGEILADAFDPARVVERFSDTWDDPTPIIKASGAKGIEALKAYVTKQGDRASYKATRLLEELSPQAAGEAKPAIAKPAAPAVKPLDVVADLAIIKGSGTPFEKGDALKRFAAGPVDPAHKDEVAGQLELIMLGSDTYNNAAAAEALAVWWRPQTVTSLLPLLDEKVWPPSKRTAAIKVLSKTHDKRVVYPIVRWIIKEPDEVVPALVEVGPVAEDEVVKLLRNADGTVRTNASRIIEQIGGQKSLAELRRAGNDPRDPAASAAAKIALEAVQARVKAAKATQPASRPS